MIISNWHRRAFHPGRQILEVLLLPLLLVGLPARSLTFNVIYDASVNALTNAAQVKTAFATATQTFQNMFTNPITINLTVYWGAIGPFSGGIFLGSSSSSLTFNTNYYAYNQWYFTYGEITNALMAARTSADDTNAVASLPGTDPVATNNWLMTLAEARALNLHASSDTNADGSIGFDATAAFTFDPANRAVPGKYDFIGVAEHEISEVMGRSYDLNYNGGAYIPYDLFRFTNSGGRSFGLTDRGVYFSVNKGVTALKYFYTNYTSGDLQDWLPGTVSDSFDASVYSGRQLNLSPADFTALDILGYNAPMPTNTFRASLRRTNSTVWLAFTNNAGATFSVLYSTNLMLAETNWTFLGNPTQTVAGHYQFTDLITTTNKTRFYRIRAP